MVVPIVSVFVALLSLLSATIVLRLLSGAINLSGLLATENGGGVEPERLQAVAVAVGVPILYAIDVVEAFRAEETLTALPGMPEWMLVVAGASQTLYVGGKIARNVARPV